MIHESCVSYHPHGTTCLPFWCLLTDFMTSTKLKDFAISALTLLVGRQEGHPKPVKNWVMGCWHGYLSCLELGADLHMAQLILLPLTVSCFSKIQIGFTFLVPAHPGSPGKRAVKRVCVRARARAKLKDLCHESKKQDIKLLPITCPNVNQFSKSFSWQTHW